MTEAEIIALERRRLDAMQRADVPLLEQLLDDDFEFFQGDGRYDRKASTIQPIAEGKVRYRRLELSDPRAYVFGDTAIVFHTMDLEVDFFANPGIRARRAVTAVWRERPDGWKLVIYKGVEIPLE